MPYDMAIDSAKLDAALSATADAIRTKTNGTEKIAWDESTGFSSAVLAITSSGRLPNGYTELAYLQGDGGQYLDMGWTPQQGDILTIDLALSSGTSESAFAGYPDQWEMYFKGNSNYMTPAVWSNRTKLTTLQIPSGAVSYNQRITVQVRFDSTQDTGAAYLFRYRTDRYPFAGRIFRATVENSSGEKIRDFVPCINHLGVYGMYDLANDVFYSNIGSGSFF